MRFPKDFPLQNSFNHGQNKWLDSPLKHIPPFLKRSCISIVQFASSQFSNIAPKKSSSSMHASFAASAIPPSPVPICMPCMSISTFGVVASIGSGFLVRNHLSAANGSSGSEMSILIILQTN